jgi:hypothetical protein
VQENKFELIFNELTDAADLAKLNISTIHEDSEEEIDLDLPKEKDKEDKEQGEKLSAD